MLQNIKSAKNDIKCVVLSFFFCIFPVFVVSLHANFGQLGIYV